MVILERLRLSSKDYVLVFISISRILHVVDFNSEPNPRFRTQSVGRHDSAPTFGRVTLFVAEKPTKRRRVIDQNVDYIFELRYSAVGEHKNIQGIPVEEFGWPDSQSAGWLVGEHNKVLVGGDQGA